MASAPPLGQLPGRAQSAVAGFKTGFKSGFYRVVERSSATPGTDCAAARAEQALADFEAASRPLERHPHLAAFWREVDRLAQRSADGQRSTVFREVNVNPAIRCTRCSSAKRRPIPTWPCGTSVRTWPSSGSSGVDANHARIDDGRHGMVAHPAQQDRLRAVCLGVPPATDRPCWWRAPRGCCAIWRSSSARRFNARARGPPIPRPRPDPRGPAMEHGPRDPMDGLWMGVLAILAPVVAWWLWSEAFVVGAFRLKLAELALLQRLAFTTPPPSN